MTASLGTVKISWSDEKGKQNAFLVTFDQKHIFDPKGRVPKKFMKRAGLKFKMKVIHATS